MASRSSTVPMPPPIGHAPKPITGTSGPSWPSWRCCTVEFYPRARYHPGPVCCRCRAQRKGVRSRQPHPFLIGGCMASVTGFGGAFIRAQDPEALYSWYEQHLGLARSDGFFSFSASAQRAQIVFSFFGQDDEYFPPAQKVM